MLSGAICLVSNGNDISSRASPTMKARQILKRQTTCARDNNTILTLKTGDQTWSRLTQVIIVVYYTTVDRYTTNSRPILHRQSMVNVSAQCRVLYRPRYRLTVDQHIGRCIGCHINRYIDRHISVDISAECWSICQPIHRSSAG